MVRRPGGVRARAREVRPPLPLVVQNASLRIMLVLVKEWRGWMWSNVNVSSSLSSRALLPAAKRLLRWRLGAGRALWVPGSVSLQPPGKLPPAPVPPPGLLRRRGCAEVYGPFASCEPP